jgi:hypothetical protein
VIPGELAVAVQDFGAHAGVNFQEAGEVGGGHLGLIEDVLEHSKSRESGEIDCVAFGFVGFHKFDEGFEIIGLITGKFFDLHETIDHFDRVLVVYIVADCHGGHEAHEFFKVARKARVLLTFQFCGHGYGYFFFFEDGSNELR